MFKCEKHGISYVAADIVKGGDGPQCPKCREEWLQQKALEQARSPEGLHVEPPPTLGIHVSDSLSVRGDMVR